MSGVGIFSRLGKGISGVFTKKPVLVDFGKVQLNEAQIETKLAQTQAVANIRKTNAEAAALDPLGAKLKLGLKVGLAGIVGGIGAYFGGYHDANKDKTGGGGGGTGGASGSSGLCAWPVVDAICGGLGGFGQTLAYILIGIVAIIVIWILVKIFGGRGHGGPKFHLDG